MSSFNMADYHLARRAGWTIYDPQTETPEQGAVRSALRTARMLAAYRNDPETFVEWDYSDLEWDGDCPMPPGTVLLDAALYAHTDEAVIYSAGLGAVCVYSERDDYCRIVEAELYEEYLAAKQILKALDSAKSKQS